MDDPKVAALLPVYNGERYLREAIASVLAQTFTDFELLIINDRVNRRKGSNIGESRRSTDTGGGEREEPRVDVPLE